MKRLVLLIGIVIFSMNAIAQDRGDMYILTSATASFGRSYGNTFDNHGIPVSTTEKPLNTYLGVDLGFGCFVAKNFRLELSLGAYYERDPREKATSDSWLSNKYRGITVCPNLSYYVKLADRFYYTPEVGVAFDLGKYVYDETLAISWEFPYRGYSIYANLIAFMYRVGPHFALSAIVGDLSYTHRSYYDDGVVVYSGGASGFNLNSGSVAAQIYF